MKTQILLIGGADSFEKHDDYIEYLKTRPMTLNHFRTSTNWKNSLQAVLGDTFDVLIPIMPNNMNARYYEWKIWFDRIVQLLDKEIILIGHSVGGIFLMQYLSDNTIPIKIRATILLAAPFVTKDSDTLVDFHIDPKLPGVESQLGRIVIYHSIDDAIVPVSHARLYMEALPSAEFHILEECAHLNNPEFPEIIETIRSIK